MVIDIRLKLEQKHSLFKSFIQNSINFIRWNNIFLVSKLNKWIKKQRVNNSIIVVGDSHSKAFSGSDNFKFCPLYRMTNFHRLPFFSSYVTTGMDEVKEFSTLNLGSVLAYSLNKRNTRYLGREKIEYFIKKGYIPKNAKILCVFGEIDLRAHVLKIVEKEQKTYEEIINDILNKYLEFLLWLKSQGFKVCAYGAVPQTWVKPEEINFPLYGSELERNKMAAYFDERLKTLCEENKIGFLSIFKYVVDDNFKTDSTYFIEDNHHLNQKIMPYIKLELEKVNWD